MKRKNIFYGLKIPQDIPLNMDNRRNLAKILLLNHRIPVKNVSKIVIDNRYWEAVLKHGVGCSVDFLDKSICESTDNTSRIKNMSCFKYKKFKSRLFLWIKEFSVPTFNEVECLANDLKVDYNILMTDIISFIQNDYMPPEKVIDFLEASEKTLSMDHIDSILDLYLDRKQDYKLN